jgi:hypothetical protein
MEAICCINSIWIIEFRTDLIQFIMLKNGTWKHSKTINGLYTWRNKIQWTP